MSDCPARPEPYFRSPGLGPDCSTERSARLRERRFAMGYEERSEPPDYTRLATEARDIYLQHEAEGPGMARARALRHVVEHCPITLEPETVFIGGEDPFFFNLMLPTLQADRHSREYRTAPDEASAQLRDAGMYFAACFEGHITPGLEFILGQGVTGLRQRVEEELANRRAAGALTGDQEDFYSALLLSCESGLVYAGRHRQQALELVELFLLAFRHEDYYTHHQPFTPGSQASLGGMTPLGDDGFNDLTELLLEASLRIAMPAPYLSLRLHRDASERAWRAYANYVAGGLGFPVVNDEVLIPAFLRHGRALYDARDYICSCCYENTIPGREAFHPNGCYLNLPFVLELALNQGRSLVTGELLGLETPPLAGMAAFDDVLEAFGAQLHYASERLVAIVNAADERHSAYRRYPLMSLLMEDCIANGRDVCAGGARYNLTGCIVAGLPNVVNSLAAIRELVFETGIVGLSNLAAALQADFASHDQLQRQLRAAPKWGNGDDRVDDLAQFVTEALYGEFRHRVNARGGRWQLALYSFIANHTLGQFVGASADGRPAQTSLTRNLNPAWGTDSQGPTGVLRSLSHIDFTKFPDGSALDLRFDPALFRTASGRETLAAFLKACVELGVMQVQVSMVDTATLEDAREHPERYPHLMVKVAGYSARFVDLTPVEQEEIIGRTAQHL